MPSSNNLQKGLLVVQQDFFPTYLDVNSIVVHLVAVSVNLQGHVLVLEVAVQLVLHAVVGLNLLVHLGYTYSSTTMDIFTS